MAFRARLLRFERGRLAEGDRSWRWGRVGDGREAGIIVRRCRFAESGYDVESRLTVYADAGDVPDLEGVDCDISYSLIRGATWVSELEARWGADDLLELAGERICEGN